MLGAGAPTHPDAHSWCQLTLQLEELGPGHLGAWQPLPSRCHHHHQTPDSGLLTSGVTRSRSEVWVRTVWWGLHAASRIKARLSAKLCPFTQSHGAVGPVVRRAGLVFWATPKLCWVGFLPSMGTRPMASAR